MTDAPRQLIPVLASPALAEAAVADAVFTWRHVATHDMGARRLFIYRDDVQGVTQLAGENSSGYGPRAGKVYYYADDSAKWAPSGPYHTEQALRDAVKARDTGQWQSEMELELEP